MKKFFAGRDLIIKNQDLKYLIKHSFQYLGLMFFLNKLTKFLLSKENGGSRTTHQIHQVSI